MTREEAGVTTRQARTRTVAAVVAMVALAGCGNTATKGSDTTTAASTATTTAPTDAPTSSAAASTGTEAPSVTDAPETTAADTTAEPTTTVAPKGVTDDTITIGVSLITNPAAAQSQVGTTGIDFLEQQDVFQKIVDDLNARGGIGGKQIEVVYDVTDVSTTVDPKAFVQRECAMFTEDNEIAAYVGLYTPPAEVRTCLSDANVPMIVSSGAAYVAEDAQDMADTPLFVNVSALNLTRAAGTLVAGLEEAGFFTPDAKVGVLRLTSPAFDRAATDGLEPALAAAGVTPVAEQAIAAVQSTDDLARVSSEAAEAVVKFQAAGVDHLVMFEYGGSLPFYFTNAASQQGYAPALGLSTLDGGQLLVQNIHTGGTVVSWEPLTDVTAGIPEWPERAACLDLVDPTRAVFGSPNQEYEATRMCDSLWLLAAAAEASGDLSADGILAGVADLGDTYVSPVVGPTSFSADQHDGVTEYRLAQYDTSCECNVFTREDPTPIP